MRRSCVLWLLVLATACDDNEGDASDSQTSSGTSAGVGPGFEDIEDYRQHCQAQTDEAQCRAVPDWNHPDGLLLSCRWVSWVGVEHDPESQTCEFGEVTGECVMDRAGSEGCLTGVEGTCTDEMAYVRQAGGGVALTKAPLCAPPLGTELCAPLDGGDFSVPECACLCDPGFPG